MNLSFSLRRYFLVSLRSYFQPFWKRKHLVAAQLGCGVLHVFAIFILFFIWHSPDILPAGHSDEFTVFTDQQPLSNSSTLVRFDNTPVALQRPRNQFWSSSLAALPHFRRFDYEPSVLTVITITKNPRDVFWETAAFVRQQSLQSIRWLIVNDYSDAPHSFHVLEKVARQDHRVLLLNSTYEPGFSNGRMFGLSYLLDNPTPYFAFLDDDDMFELTAYEKCAWMLESNKNVSMCGSYVVGFGDKNYTWTHGFHSGVRVVIDNPLTGSEVARFSILEATGCEFDEDLKTGMEDWDFYLCVASKGLWGATIPEYLFWYRQNPTALRQQRWGSLFEGEEKTAERIRKRYSSLEHNFPKVHVPPTEEFEQMNLTLPFANKLRLRKSVLFIIPWMSIGGGDTANLRLIEEMSRKGYRITIVCTMLNLHDNSMASKPLFMQYTHDIFTIPAMVRLADAPRFFSYLVESRGVGRIILCNSQLGYGILPWLSSKYKDIVFIDYVHNEEPDWKNGGYAAFSTVHQHSLDATFTSSRSTRQFMIEHGRQPDNLHVGYLGIDLSHLHPLQDEEKAATRTNLGIPLEATVVIYLARMVEHKQPRVALESFLKVMKNIASEDGKGISSLSRKYRLVMIGDGPMLREVTRLAKEHSELVMIFGSLEHSDALKYLSVSDVFCLPSTSEGVSFALAESMAFGVTALTSNVGGFSDLLYESGSYGVMVNATGNIVTDNDAFAKELKTLLGHAKLRDEMGTRAAQRVRAFFNADQRIPDLVKRMLSAKRTRAVVHTAEDELSTLHYTQSTVIRDVGVFSDYGEIHRSMQGKERNAFGTKYRAVCGEYNEVLSRLIDILEEPSGCDPDMELDVEKFQNAALEQCGRWCVMNYDDPKRQSGWQVKESCQGVDLFSGANHKCSKWFHSIQK